MLHRVDAYLKRVAWFCLTAKHTTDLRITHQIAGQPIPRLPLPRLHPPSPLFSKPKRI